MIANYQVLPVEDSLFELRVGKIFLALRALPTMLSNADTLAKLLVALGLRYQIVATLMLAIVEFGHTGCLDVRIVQIQCT